MRRARRDDRFPSTERSYRSASFSISGSQLGFPFVRHFERVLLVEIVSHHDGRAFGLDLFSLGVDELVVQREAFVTHPDDSGAYGDRLVAAGLDEVVRLACNDDQSGRFPVRSQAEHLLVKVALSRGRNSAVD